jgi:aconitate decarboxylase
VVAYQTPGPVGDLNWYIVSRSIIHPTGPVASALLAAAEWRGGISGKQFITALVAGIEAECKTGLAVWPEHYDVGW